jgi:Peroxiredoxin
MVEPESDHQLIRGEEAPTFDLPGTDGQTHALSDYDDHDGVLVVFTCNHCPYAQAKFDELNRLAEEFDEVAVIGINPNDPAEYPEDDFETMVEYVNEGRINYDAYLQDESQEVAAAYGAVCTPDPFLLENDGGTFRLVYHGRLDDAPNPNEEVTDREIRTHIQTMLAGEPVTDDSRPSRGCSIKWQAGNKPAYAE